MSSRRQQLQINNRRGQQSQPAGFLVVYCTVKRNVVLWGLKGPLTAFTVTL